MPINNKMLCEIINVSIFNIYAKKREIAEDKYYCFTLTYLEATNSA